MTPHAMTIAVKSKVPGKMLQHRGDSFRNAAISTVAPCSIHLNSEQKMHEETVQYPSKLSKSDMKQHVHDT